MNYWYMQMHQAHSAKASLVNVCTILEQKKIIGLGRESEAKDQIDYFRKKMQVNDVIAITAGSKFIALVQVIGGDYEVKNDNDKITDWLVYRRPIRVLDWEIDGKKVRECPHARETLKMCKNDSDDTLKVIKSWHKNVISSLKKRGISQTV